MASTVLERTRSQASIQKARNDVDFRLMRQRAGVRISAMFGKLVGPGRIQSGPFWIEANEKTASRRRSGDCEPKRNSLGKPSVNFITAD